MGLKQLIGSRAVVSAALLALVLAPICFVSAEGSQIQLAVDTSVSGQDGLLTIYGGQRLGGELGLPVAAADLNGDGRGDVVFCEMYASTGSGFRQNNGQVNFYLSDGRDSGTVDAATNPASISTLAGQRPGDLLGTAVSTGDVNGDGISDVIVSAALNDGPDGSRFNAGAVYVIPGSANFGFHADLGDPGTGLPQGMTTIYGAQPDGRFGIWIETGDVDGDGIADIVVGADQLNSNDGTQHHVGGAYIIFGSKNLPLVIDLASPPPGVRITRIVGANQQDHWGAALAVGDLNGDGIADVVISAALDRDSASYVTPTDQSSGENDDGASDGGTRLGCGEVYVLFGSKSWPAEIDLANPPAGSTHIIGAHQGDLCGSQVFTADLNGDGKRDLIIGALQAHAPDAVLPNGDPLGPTGAVYVVYGSSQFPGATVDLLNPSASGLQVTSIFGEHSLDCAGDSVRAYDINGDGMAELFIGSPDSTFTINGDEREDAGDTKILFGQPGFLPPVIKLYDPPANLTFYRLAGAHGAGQGVNGGDEFSYRLAGADVDGDGYLDYVANAMHGDGAGNTVTDAGNVYIFSGKKLSAKLGLLPVTATTPVITSATLSQNGQVIQQAKAGTAGLLVTINGSGFETGLSVFINGIAVNPIAVDPPPPGTPPSQQRLVSLDDNAAVKNAAGPLAVTVQNTNPSSPLSNAITAGTLTGPQINKVTVRVKGSGLILLKIFGSSFDPGSSAGVTAPDGSAVPLKAVAVLGSGLMTARIAGQHFAHGTALLIRVMTPGGVQSQPFSAVVP